MSEEFGRYRLAEKIGEGGLSEVYRAEAQDGSVVALKRLSRAHLDNAELAEVFASEVKISTAIHGPGLLGTTDSGDVDGWPFLVMPFAPGKTLASEIEAGGGTESSRAARLARELNQALTTMHRLGYVHADLSPENVLFAEDGSALLGDFSAATQVGSPQPRPLGTFSYMSPEQVRGQALDARSDVFSLGVLLWECTSGQRIFWREAQHLCFMAVVESDPPAMPAEHLGLETILRKAVAKEPGERHQSVDALCSAYVAAL